MALICRSTFFDRTSFPEGASSLPLRHSAKKTTKTSNKQKENKLLSYQPPSRKIKPFFRNKQYFNVLQLYFHFSIYICLILSFINECKYFQFSVLNIKVKSKMCINFIFYFVKLLI